MKNLSDDILWPYDDEEEEHLSPSDNYDLNASQIKLDKHEDTIH